MSEIKKTHTMQDEHEIADLLYRWGHARDSDDWDALAGCFHSDATIHISWISAPAAEFVARSRGMAAARKPGHHIKHLIAGPWIMINGTRAFSRCNANLYIRMNVEGHEFDLQSWMRFFDLLEKRNGVWRLVKRTAVYDKDRLDPVDPRGAPKGFFDGMDLSAYPDTAKFLCYILTRMGQKPLTGLIAVYSDEERALKNEGEAWIAGAV